MYVSVSRAVNLIQVVATLERGEDAPEGDAQRDDDAPPQGRAGGLRRRGGAAQVRRRRQRRRQERSTGGASAPSDGTGSGLGGTSATDDLIPQDDEHGAEDAADDAARPEGEPVPGDQAREQTADEGSQDPEEDRASPAQVASTQHCPGNPSDDDAERDDAKDQHGRESSRSGGVGS